MLFPAAADPGVLLLWSIFHPAQGLTAGVSTLRPCLWNFLPGPGKAGRAGKTPCELLAEIWFSLAMLTVEFRNCGVLFKQTTHLKTSNPILEHFHVPTPSLGHLELFLLVTLPLCPWNIQIFPLQLSFTCPSFFPHSSLEYFPVYFRYCFFCLFFNWTRDVLSFGLSPSFSHRDVQEELYLGIVMEN